MIHIIASIISYDIWFYISHIMLHHPTLYKYHKEHHSKKIPTYIDTYVGHILEGPFQGIGMFFPILIWTYNKYDILLIFVLLNIRGMMRHDERFIFICGNIFLRMYPHYNFGEYWIDVLCGTQFVPSTINVIERQ